MRFEAENVFFFGFQTKDVIEEILPTFDMLLNGTVITSHCMIIKHFAHLES